MEKTKGGSRENEPESLLQYAIDTLLLPLRIATSPVLLRTYLRTILLFITSCVLFGLATVAYTSFYYSYIPVRGITVPVYLQYDHSSFQPSSIIKSDTKQWPYGISNIPGLVSRQKYDVTIELVVPRSTTNLNAGNWMVGLEMRSPPVGGGGFKEMLGWDEEWNVQDHSHGGVPRATTQKTPTDGLAGSPIVLARSKRPAILTYRSHIIEHAYHFLRLPLYLVDWHTESEHIKVNMMNSVQFDRGLRNVPSSVRIELQSRNPLEIYSVAVRFSARLEGLRWLMYRYWLSSAVAGICLFWSVEMSVLLVTWAIFTFIFGKSSNRQQQPTHKRIKQEEGASTPKREPNGDTEPETPLSDTSRTFPTLSSHQPLHYQSTSPTPAKEERSTPALEDIPTREEAEADDEDDDFVLEEPARISERGETFIDSGIDTSIQSSSDQGHIVRRRSGRMTNGER
ncbi:putative adipose-regulatory protein-domain-containing protein [Phaeosphaeriaceae sp. PMI808]|nr:putative adipose-regulatory protein-domain-containing protein [Phaeosphaeriaceae sp. PMI808]